MSNWLTVRLVASRSIARRAPISYTPPVNPPPPRTSAVLDGDRRARRRRVDCDSVPAASIATTFPIAARGIIPSGTAVPPQPASDHRYAAADAERAPDARDRCGGPDDRAGGLRRDARARPTRGDPRWQAGLRAGRASRSLAH